MNPELHLMRFQVEYGDQKYNFEMSRAQNLAALYEKVRKLIGGECALRFSESRISSHGPFCQMRAAISRFWSQGNDTSHLFFWI